MHLLFPDYEATLTFIFTLQRVLGAQLYGLSRVNAQPVALKQVLVKMTRNYS